MDLNMRSLLTVAVTFLRIHGSVNSQIFKIETVLASACSLVSYCEDPHDLSFTVEGHGLNITLTVTWAKHWDAFELYSYIKSLDSRNVDLLILDEHLTRRMLLPEQSPGHPFILLLETFWFDKEKPTQESDNDCCADFVYVEEPESKMPKQDVSKCLGWSDPATGAVAVIRHLQWKEIVLLFDGIHENEAKAVTSSLENCKFHMYKLDSNFSQSSLLNHTSSIASRLGSDANSNMASIKKMEIDGEEKIRDLLRTIYTDVPLEKNIHFVLMCTLDNIKRILSLANRFDKENYRKYALHFRSRWLISLPTGRAVGNEMTQFFEGLDNLDNIAVIDSRYTLDKSSFNISANMQNLLQELMSQLEDLNEKISVWNLSTSLSQILQSRYQRCTDTRVNTLYFGGQNGRYLNTVATVNTTETVVLSGQHDVFPNAPFALNKRNLTISVVQFPPFVNKTDAGYEGFCIDLLRQMETVLNFTATIVSTDREWGKQLTKDGPYSGLVGQLERHEIDMAVAPMTLFATRENVMDFAFPFFTDYTTVMLRMPNANDSKWRTLIQPFKWQVHLTIWISLFSVAALITVLERQNPYYRNKPERSAFYRLTDSVWYMYGSLLTQGGEHLPKSTTGLTLVSFWLMFAVIVASTYSGNLIAFLTVTIDTPPFNTLEGMLDQQKYKWGTVGGSPYERLVEFQQQEQTLKQSVDPVKNAVWENIKMFNRSDPTVLSPNYKDHLEKVYRGYYAYIGDNSVIDVWSNEACDLTTIKEKFFPRQYAIGLVKNSAYTFIVSNEMIKLGELGLLQMWRSRWWSKKYDCQGPLVTQATAITVHEVQSAFYVMCIGIVLSALILGVEKLRAYISTRRISRRFTFSRSESYRNIELTLNKHITIRHGGNIEVHNPGIHGATSSAYESTLENDPEMNLQGHIYTLDLAPQRFFDNETESLNQLADSFYADSLDSGYDDHQQRKKAYIFNDKVPFYLSRISLPTFLGRSRSTSL